MLCRGPSVLKLRSSTHPLWRICAIALGLIITPFAAGIPNSGNFRNIRVAYIDATHKRWSARGSQFIIEPMERGPEIRGYLRHPDAT